MANIVTWKLEIKSETKPVEETKESVHKLGEEIADAQKKSVGLKDSLVNFAAATSVIKNIVDLIGSVTSKLNECVEANQLQVFAETKLEQVMHNTLNATDEQIQSVKDLASEIQGIGVVGDEVTLAGLGELSSYIYEDADSVKALAPAMTDLVAYIDGYNASQGTAVSVAQMMGKVLEGQTGALSRQGFIFDEAQEKVLKYGTEQERVAMLAEVIEQSVGGVNEALAATPEGKMTQVANSYGDLKEKIGALVTKIYNALAPALNWIIETASSIITFIEENYRWLGLIAAAIGTLTVAINAHTIITKIASGATKAWEAAQWVLNAALTANPIGIIIALIVALIAVIVFLCEKISGWATLWDAVCTFCKESFMFFVDSIKLAWTATVNGIMIGLDKIKLGWYEFKEAIGWGDSSENQAAIAEINADVENRKREIVDGAKAVGEHAMAMKNAWDKVDMKWNDDVTFSSTKDKLMNSLVGGPVTPNGSTKVDGGLSDSLSKATTSISDGGKQSKTFNITIGNILGENTNIFQSSSDDPESASAFMEKLSNALQMVVNDVNYAAQ